MDLIVTPSRLLTYFTYSGGLGVSGSLPSLGRLYKLKAAGLSQYELAEMREVPQSNVAFWEQSEKPPRSDLLPKMADVLGVEIVDLLNTNGGRVTVQRRQQASRQLRKAFDDVSRLPHRQHEHIVRVVSALVMQYEQSRQ